MSRSVPSTKVLAVPVCPTVPAKQSFHPFKETIWPLGENALSCEILRWLFDCFLANTVVFLPVALRYGTRTLFSYQGTRTSLLHQVGKVKRIGLGRCFIPPRPQRKNDFSSPGSNTGAFKSEVL